MMGEENKDDDLTFVEKYLDTGWTGYVRQFNALAKQGDYNSLFELRALTDDSTLHLDKALDALDRNGSDAAVFLMGKLAVQHSDYTDDILKRMENKSNGFAIKVVQDIVDHVSDDDNAETISQQGANTIDIIQHNIDALKGPQENRLNPARTTEDVPVVGLGTLEL